MARTSKSSDVPRDEGARAKTVEEAPDSAISKTAPYLDDVEKLGDLNLVNLLDLEKRIGLMTRIIIEAALRAPRHLMTIKDKADVALRAITVLEGSKQQVIWRDDLLKKTTPKSVEEYDRELNATDARLRKLLTRRSEIKVKEAQAALDAAQAQSEPDDKSN